MNKIHHINFVVKDLGAAVKQYEKLFGLLFENTENHPSRPVATARCKLGEVWLVLVQPLQDDCVPGKVLKEKGEGFFLISYEVDDLSKTIDNIKSQGGEMIDLEPREGISNWQVADIDPSNTFGVLTQICQESAK
jgi:methylmalonyl-CoA/ethylmalonyl-CoA epimerase